MTKNANNELLGISNNKAKAVLYSLAKRCNGKLRIETFYRIGANGKGMYALSCDINGFYLTCSKWDDLFVWFDKDKLDFYRKNKYRSILANIINAALEGKDIKLGVKYTTYD